MSEFILIERNEHIATLTLNRPEKRNALNGKMIKEISHALTLIESDSAIRVLMINGHGEHFCAGADIGWMQTIASGSYEANYDDAEALADMLYQLYNFSKPTMVLAHGATMGGGLGLLAACDIAIVGSSASFGFSEVKIGITPATISPYIIAAIGERAAHYYFLTGERFDAKAALQMQLAHRFVDDSKLIAIGREVANTLLANSPQALTRVKQLIRRVTKEPITAQLAQKTAEELARLRATAEAQEGLRSFIEKRKPKWC